MHIFKPYLIIEDTDTFLHLRLSAYSKIISIITFRVLPIFTIILMGCFFYFTNDKVPFMIYFGLLIIFIISIFQFFTKIVCDVYFSDKWITIISFKMINNIREHYLLQDISHVNLVIYTPGRSAGAYYKLCLKNNKKITLINLPIFLSLKKEKLRQLNQKIVQITRLKIEGDLKILK